MIQIENVHRWLHFMPLRKTNKYLHTSPVKTVQDPHLCFEKSQLVKRKKKLFVHSQPVNANKVF